MSSALKQKPPRRRLANGKFYPLGATLQDAGVNFAVYSKHAACVYLLLFDEPGGLPTDIIRLEARTRDIWHVFVPGLRAGQLYAYKADGEYNPKYGFRFNPHKLLIDPYAKALTHKLFNKDNLLFGYDPQFYAADLSFDSRDNTRLVPKCIVIDDDDFDWQGDTHPDIPPQQTVIYETHLKGFSRHRSAGVKYPGTYAGFAEKIPYLKDLGITAVEFLPLQEHYTDDFLLKKGLSNYWGYSPLAYFAPELAYASGLRPGAAVNEFKMLVRQLHKAGIEVILDVVFNHTCEGNELGPTVSFRGLDNLTYYHLYGEAHQPARYYADYTGCGNTFNAASRPALRLVMDSLRYWVEVMHVDGFRFDLASALGRKEDAFGATASFFDAVAQDPVLSRIKLIAEPWDIKTYQAGNFPVDWCEWNGRFRDVIRKFARGDPGQMKELGARIFGSQDIYGANGRVAFSSINFITCHDGFTLRDLVSYNSKHNQANGEDNRDGADENNSWNCGFEGETPDADIAALRKKQIKNFAAYLLFSGGTPMILGGDEFCRTQKGNNNAYCQDNGLSWFDWRLLKKNSDIHRFFRGLIRLALRYRLSRSKGRGYGNLLPAQVEWFSPELETPAWDNPQSRTLCLLLPASETGAISEDYFAVFNADSTDRQVRLPRLEGRKKWHRAIDTALSGPADIAPAGKETVLKNQENYLAGSRSVLLLVGKAKK